MKQQRWKYQARHWNWNHSINYHDSSLCFVWNIRCNSRKPFSSSGNCDLARGYQPIAKESGWNGHDPHAQVWQGGENSQGFDWETQNVAHVFREIGNHDEETGTKMEDLEHSTRGRNESLISYPQSWPTWAVINAHIGTEVKIYFHGTGGRESSLFNLPNSTRRYSFSSSLINGWDSGSL